MDFFPTIEKGVFVVIRLFIFLPLFIFKYMFFASFLKSLKYFIVLWNRFKIYKNPDKNPDPPLDFKN